MIENLNFPELIESIFLKNDNRDRALSSEETIDLLFEEYWNGDNIWFKEKWKEFRELDGNNMMFDLKSGFRKFKSMLQTELETDYEEELLQKNIIKELSDGVYFVGFTSSFFAPVRDSEEELPTVDNFIEEVFDIADNPSEDVANVDTEVPNNQDTLTDNIVSIAEIIMTNTEPFDLASLETTKYLFAEDSQELDLGAAVSITENIISENEVVENPVEEFIEKPQEINEESNISVSELIMNETSPFDLTSLETEYFNSLISIDNISEDIEIVNEEEILQEALKIAIMDEVFDDINDDIIVLSEDSLIEEKDDFIDQLDELSEQIDNVSVFSKPIIDEEFEDTSIDFVLEEGELLKSNIDIEAINLEDTEVEIIESVLDNSDVQILKSEDTPNNKPFAVENAPISFDNDNVFLDNNYGPIQPSLSQALGNFGILPFGFKPVDTKKSEYNEEKPHVLTYADNLPSDIEDIEDVCEQETTKVLLAEENGFSISQIIDNIDAPSFSSEAELFPILSEFIKSNHNFNAYSKSMSEPENEWNQPRFVALGGDICNEKNDELFNEFAGSSQQDLLKIFSFNIKLEVNLNNMREYFFQTVSNSNWSNEGFLVISSIDEENNRLIREELKRLSAVYGIGIILLDTENAGHSEIISLSEARLKIDLNFVNKLISNSTNTEFRDFIANINEMKKSGNFNKDFFDNTDNNEN